MFTRSIPYPIYKTVTIATVSAENEIDTAGRPITIYNTHASYDLAVSDDGAGSGEYFLLVAGGEFSFTPKGKVYINKVSSNSSCTYAIWDVG